MLQRNVRYTRSLAGATPSRSRAFMTNFVHNARINMDFELSNFDDSFFDGGALEKQRRRAGESARPGARKYTAKACSPEVWSMPNSETFVA